MVRVIPIRPAPETEENRMFLLFGLRTRDHLISTHSGPCDFCGVVAMQALGKRTTKFTLFFVPLFPVRPSRYYIDCSNCERRRPTNRAGRMVTHVS
jgi:hypothetical protein